ncbi:peptidoglycan recognition family protein [Chryseobacterium sp. C39-AII1]|uniref:peptidoglycan recognition protein family protein n=1 Tax=Chryseobacterium sp. C39-AII1 TaxID=3080332 RepID=UPI003208F75F
MLKNEWGAKDPIKNGRSWESLPISLSAYYDTITIHHSGNAKNYMTIQQLQDKEQNDGYADIPYHFAIDSKGNIYEGRPIYIKGAHTAGANTSNIGIVLMSDLDYQNKGLSFEKFLVENYINGNGGASTAMRKSLTNLVSYLNSQYGIQYLGGHIEKINDTRYCPGDGGMKIVNYLRQKFNMQIPIKQ